MLIPFFEILDKLYYYYYFSIIPFFIFIFVCVFLIVFVLLFVLLFLIFFIVLLFFFFYVFSSKIGWKPANPWLLGNTKSLISHHDFWGPWFTERHACVLVDHKMGLKFQISRFTSSIWCQVLQSSSLFCSSGWFFFNHDIYPCAPEWMDAANDAACAKLDIIGHTCTFWNSAPWCARSPHRIWKESHSHQISCKKQWYSLAAGRARYPHHTATSYLLAAMLCKFLCGHCGKTW